MRTRSASNGLATGPTVAAVAKPSRTTRRQPDAVAVDCATLTASATEAAAAAVPPPPPPPDTASHTSKPMAALATPVAPLPPRPTIATFGGAAPHVSLSLLHPDHPWSTDALQATANTLSLLPPHPVTRRFKVSVVYDAPADPPPAVARVIRRRMALQRAQLRAHFEETLPAEERSRLALLWKDAFKRTEPPAAPAPVPTPAVKPTGKKGKRKSAAEGKPSKKARLSTAPIAVETAPAPLYVPGLSSEETVLLESLSAGSLEEVAQLLDEKASEASGVVEESRKRAEELDTRLIELRDLKHRLFQAFRNFINRASAAPTVKPEQPAESVQEEVKEERLNEDSLRKGTAVADDHAPFQQPRKRERGKRRRGGKGTAGSRQNAPFQQQQYHHQQQQRDVLMPSSMRPMDDGMRCDPSRDSQSRPPRFRSGANALPPAFDPGNANLVPIGQRPDARTSTTMTEKRRRSRSPSHAPQRKRVHPPWSPMDDPPRGNDRWSTAISAVSTPLTVGGSVCSTPRSTTPRATTTAALPAPPPPPPPKEDYHRRRVQLPETLVTPTVSNTATTMMDTARTSTTPHSSGLTSPASGSAGSTNGTHPWYQKYRKRVTTPVDALTKGSPPVPASRASGVVS